MSLAAPSVTSVAAVSSQLPRLGQISYINCLPMAIPMELGYVDVACRTVYAIPSELNQSYAEGALDLGVMSSFFYLTHDRLEIIPELSISADGQVGSVLFFCKDDPGKLNGRKVKVPADSATSVNLLRILLKEQFAVEPELVVDTDPNFNDCETMGALLIGDRALAADTRWATGDLHRKDLGEWWRTHTGLPMVFAVWAARSDWSTENPSQFLAIGDALRESIDLGLSGLLPQVIDEAEKRTGLTADRLRHYYRRELNFQLTEQHKSSLELFRKLCCVHGLMGNAGSR